MRLTRFAHKVVGASLPGHDTDVVLHALRVAANPAPRAPVLVDAKRATRKVDRMVHARITEVRRRPAEQPEHHVAGPLYLATVLKPRAPGEGRLLVESLCTPRVRPGNTQNTATLYRRGASKPDGIEHAVIEVIRHPRLKRPGIIEDPAVVRRTGCIKRCCPDTKTCRRLPVNVRPAVISHWRRPCLNINQHG